MAPIMPPLAREHRIGMHPIQGGLLSFIHLSGVMAIKATKFCNLTRGRMCVLNYANHFNYLVQHAPNDILIDEVNYLKFMNSLFLMMQDKMPLAT